MMVAAAGVVGWFAGFVLGQLLDDVIGATALLLVPLLIGVLVGLAVLVRDADRRSVTRTLGGGVGGALAVGAGLFALADAGLLGEGGLWLLLLLLIGMTTAAAFAAIHMARTGSRIASNDTP